MCISCGCGEPDEQHGDERNLTMRQVEDAAEAAGISPQAVAANVSEAVNGVPEDGYGDRATTRMDGENRPDEPAA
jgi:hypothetical protein